MDESTHPLITISGPPAAGTSTLSKQLSDKLGYEIINGGDIFRRMASERGLTLAELTELSEDDDSIDKELDARLQQIIEDHATGNQTPDGDGLIVESRLAAWHADEHADLSVYLHAPRKIRVKRIDGRTESVEELAEREESEAERYYEYYGIDVTDRSVYDVVIDTSQVTESEMVAEVLQSLPTVTNA